MEFQLGMKRLKRVLNTWDAANTIHRKNDTGDFGVNECRVCGHIWRTRSGSVPKTCPACRSSLWNRDDIQEKRCYRCGHVWHSSLDNPARCPSCKSKVWYREILAVTCKKCGSRWESPLKNGYDVTCPKCGQLDTKDYSVSSTRSPEGGIEVFDGKNQGFTPEAVVKMRTIEGDIFRSLFLRECGLTPLQADVIVLYDKGIPVPKISSEMDVPLSNIIPIVVRYRHLMESMGATP